MTTRDNGRTPSSNCRCADCQGLAARYKDDPQLLAFYRRNLLKKGWAGSTDEVEKAYQAAHAGWYRAAQKSGQRMAEEMARREREVQVGEASGAKDEELGGQRQGTHPPQGQLALPMAVA